MYATLEFPSWQ